MRYNSRCLRNLFFVSFAATVVLAGFHLEAVAQRQGLPLPKETQIPDDGVEVDMLRYHRLPMIETKINGKGPFKLIVDTGAAGVVLKEKIAIELELPPPPGMPAEMKIQVRAPGSAGISASLFYVDTLTVGDAKISGIWTIGMELPFGDGMDGVIGMDVFNDCLLTYDYLQNRMSFEHGELPEANDRDVFSFTNPQMPNSHPEIDLSIDGQPTKFLIDTGFRGWFALDEKTIEACQVIHGPVNGEMGMSAAGLIQSEVVRIQETISAGDYSVKKPIARVMSEDLSRNMVGTMFLENFKVTFDAKNKRIRLADSTEKSWTPDSQRSLGLGLKNKDEHMLVWYVLPDSHAAEIGIEVDDLMLTIAGKPVQEIFDNKDWQSVLHDNGQLEIQYRKKDQESTLTATLKIHEILPDADASEQERN